MKGNQRVLVLGYGEMGHALEVLLAPRQALRIWQRRAPAGGDAPVLETAAAASDVLLFCLPATAHAEIAARLAPHLPADALCVTIAKGLGDDGRLPVETLTAAVGRTRTAVLYGPMIAEEIRAGKPAFAECGAHDPGAAARIGALFAGSALVLEPSADLAGLSWSAILKNVYALAFGMSDELGLGDNVRGFLAVTALRELADIVHTLGGERATPYRLAGLGDLVTTATSAGSHHHALGRQLARRERGALSGEAVHTLAVLRTHARFASARCPLFRLIEDCVREPQDVRARLTAWLDSALTAA